MTTLIEQADGLLRRPSLGRHTVRAACWIARAALEERVSSLLQQVGLEPGRSSMRTRLSCLEAAYAEKDPELAARAEYAWSRFSQAAHHHAYELTPTVEEAAHLVALVARLGDGHGQPSPKPPRARATTDSGPP